MLVTRLARCPMRRCRQGVRSVGVCGARGSASGVPLGELWGRWGVAGRCECDGRSVLRCGSSRLLGATLYIHTPRWHILTYTVWRKLTRQFIYRTRYSGTSGLHLLTSRSLQSDSNL